MLPGDRESGPEGQPGVVRATQEMEAAFRGSTARGGTDRSGTLMEVVLLFLEWKKEIDPFEDEKTFEKAQGEGTAVKRIPVDCIEDGNSGPVVMTAKIQLVHGESTVTSELSRSMMGEGNRPDLKTAFASGEERNRRERGSGSLQDPSHNEVTMDVQLNVPRTFVRGDVVIVVTLDMAKGDESLEPVEDGQNLELQIRFRVEITAWVGVDKGTAGSKAFD
jgi:hypothetical protein